MNYVWVWGGKHSLAQYHQLQSRVIVLPDCLPYEDANRCFEQYMPIKTKHKRLIKGKITIYPNPINGPVIAGAATPPSG